VTRHLAHDWFDAPLPDNVDVGERSWLYSTFSLRRFRGRHPVGLRVGHDTGIYNGTFFEVGETGLVEIGSFCSLVGAIVRTDGEVRIGDHAFLAHEVVLSDRADACPPDVPDADPAAGSRIEIGDAAWIGARSVLLGGTSIGEGAIVGAGSVVVGAVPPRTVVAGNPARVVKEIGAP
jgi:maltose O-acetyltransferase